MSRRRPAIRWTPGSPLRRGESPARSNVEPGRFTAPPLVWLGLGWFVLFPGFVFAMIVLDEWFLPLVFGVIALAAVALFVAMRRVAHD